MKTIAPDSPGARRLIELSDQYLAALYPPESNWLESIEALQKPNVCFLGIEDAGELVACGAVKLMDDGAAYGEVKRLFVLPGHRDRGYGRSIMLALHEKVRQWDVGLVRLELGVSQPEAFALYRALGYRERGPFGAYEPNPYSVFMEMPLEQD